MQTIAVQDANILIDLVKTGLFDHCLALPYRFITTDIILAELVAEQVAVIQPHINSGKFSVVTITAEELTAIVEISQEDTHLSEQDWSAFYYAEQYSALLLTGDKRLRRIASEKGIEVAGIFWVFDNLVGTGILSKPEACAFLHDLLKNNKRLPQEEVTLRITAWSE